MLAISLSSLSFIYFISFFFSKDDEGAKILFIIIFGFILIIALFWLILEDAIKQYLSSITTLYYPHLFDFIQVTSMGLYFIRIIMNNTVYKVINDFIKNDKGFSSFITNKIIKAMTYGFSWPLDYIYTSYIVYKL